MNHTTRSFFLLASLFVASQNAIAAQDAQATALIRQAAAALQQQPDQTVRLLQRLGQRGPLVPDARVLMAESYLRLNRLEQAQQEVDLLQKTAADRADVQRLLGDLASRRADWKAAEGHYARAVALQPQNPDLHLRLGQSRQSLGQETAADQSFARYRALTTFRPIH